MNTLIVFVALLASPMQQTTWRDKPVAGLVSAGQSADKLVAQLAKAADAPLLTSPEVRGEVLAVRLKNVKLGEAMDKIAEAAGAQWKEEGGKWVLWRSPGLAHEQEKAYLDSRIAGIKRLQAQTRDVVAKLPKFDETAAEKLAKDLDTLIAGGDFSNEKIEPVAAATPARQAVQRIVPVLDASLLANAQNGGRIVFSSHPTAAQYKLPDAVLDLAKQALAEHALYVAADQKILALRPPDQFRMSLGFFTQPTYRGGDPAKGVGPVLLTVSGWEGSDSLNFNLSLFDKDLGSLINESWGVAMPRENLRAFDVGEAAKTPVVFSETAKLLSASSRASASGAVHMSHFMDAGNGERVELRMVGSPNSDTYQRLPPQLESLVMNPDETDPLSIGAGEAFVQLANELDTNLVASLPDDLFSTTLWFVPTEGVTFERLFRAYLGSIDLKRDGAWTIAKPVWQATARRDRAGRTALKTLLSRLRSEGFLSLRTLGEYADSGARPPTGGVAGTYAKLVNSTALPTELGLPNFWGFMQVYGSLNDTQRASLRSAGSLSLANLSDRQRSVLSSFVYTAGNGPGHRRQYVEDMMTFGDYAEERTVAMPRGLPATTNLTMTSKSQDAALGRMSNTGYSQMLDATLLASLKYQAENPTYSKSMGYPPVFDKFTPATTYDFELQILFGEDYGMTKKLRDAELTSSSSGDFGTLPKPFKDRVEFLLGVYRRAFSTGGG